MALPGFLRKAVSVFNKYKPIAGQIYKGFNTAKKVYQAAAPIIKRDFPEAAPVLARGTQGLSVATDVLDKAARIRQSVGGVLAS